MDGMQLVLPVVGIVGVAVVTFYAVSFSELREKSFRELDEKEEEEVGFQSSMSSRDRRARRQAQKNKSKTNT